MQFNSVTFLAFFGVVLALHYSALPWKVKKLQLVIASYVFYAAWNPPFILLLWISTMVDWIAARRIYLAERRGARVLWLLASLTSNLGMLGFFKYSGFLLNTFVAGAAAVGIHYQPPTLDIVLPAGISFYTFQTLSYTIDVFRRKAGPWRSFLDYLLYVSFFPQLVAGPILRSGDFLPQCTEERRATPRQFAVGMALLTLGLFEKNVIADATLAPIADRMYGGDFVGFVATWSGALAFSGQIFCDFAGYSTCAIGAALCLGFQVPDNFRFPYASIGFSDLWKRWHISLSSWLKDYLYIPLGGSRRKRIRTHFNLMATMLLGGLWHGAAWTFVFWGGLHGAYLMIERELKKHWGGRAIWATKPAQIALAFMTFVLWTYSMVFFRAGSFTRGIAVAEGMTGLTLGGAGSPFPWSDTVVTLAVMTTMLVVHWKMRDVSLVSDMDRAPWWLRSLALAAMLVAIVVSTGADRAFIYFQF